MTKIVNDPERFTDDAMAGFVRLHSSQLKAVTGGVVRRGDRGPAKVAVVVGGGSGHYPAFMGWVGPGLAEGAVVGNVFSAPSAQYAASVARAVHMGKGVIFGYGNHAGDVLNFGMACQMLQAEGIDARSVIVTDDLLAAPPEEIQKRRGIAGDFLVFKMLGAAAEQGLPVEEVIRLGDLANARTRTIGIGLAGCTMPGQDHPLFDVESGTMGIGLGLHGEPALKFLPLPSARDIAKELVDPLMAEAPVDSKRVAVILNGLGGTKYEELFLLWNEVAQLLEQLGYDVVAPEVGELVTSLDMAGVSLSITWLNDELEPLWLAPCNTPAFRRGFYHSDITTDDSWVEADETPNSEPAISPASGQSQAGAVTLLAMFEAGKAALVDAEDELGRIDAVAGDGDHGRGMVRGVTAATHAVGRAVERNAGLGTALRHAGTAWASEAGGTSGGLWGAALVSVGEVIGDDEVSAELITTALDGFPATIERLGGAQVGDKTLLDAVRPFTAQLRETTGDNWPDALAQALYAAHEGAKGTAGLMPRVGRARPHAAHSLGTPDPGAISFVKVTEAMAEELKRRACNDQM